MVVDQFASLQLFGDEAFQFLGKVTFDAPNEADDDQDDGHGHQAKPERLLEHPLRQRLVGNLEPSGFASRTCSEMLG